MSLSANFEAHSLQNDFVVFFRLGVEDENRQALFPSLEAFTYKIQGKTANTLLTYNGSPRFLSNCVIISWFNSGMRIKYDRTCQQSIKIISIEKTFALHKSAQKKPFFLEFFFLKKAFDELYYPSKNCKFRKMMIFYPG